MPKKLDPIEAENFMRENGFEPLEPYSTSYAKWRCLCKKCGKEITPTKLQTQLPKEMFVFSDTPLLAKEISALEVAVPHLNLIFLSEDDLGSGTVHDMMRISKVLITANSTFSFSAGLLSSKETLVYCPLMFFGGQDDYLKSRIFNQSCDYFLMR